MYVAFYLVGLPSLQEATFILTRAKHLVGKQLVLGERKMERKCVRHQGQLENRPSFLQMASIINHLDLRFPIYL